MNLSLMQALNEDRLEDFLTQEESRGIGPISAAEFDETAAAVIRTPQSDDQTSGSPHSGDLTGK